MTDPFEEAVRQAAQGLGSTTQIPSYHDAWHRGRRRRLVKRSALAAAGVLVFIAALSVNLGRLPGTGSTEGEEVVVGIEAATPSVSAEVPTPLATTAPIEAPTDSADESAVITALPTAEPTATAAPTSEPRSTATVAPSAEPTAPPTAAALPPATSAPTEVPTPQAEPSAQPTTFALQVAPTSTPELLQLPEVTEIPDGAGETRLVPDDGAATVPGDEQAAQIAIAGADQRPDAVILERQGVTAGLDCDIDQNGSADATCELLPDYQCTGDNDVNPGYGSFDDNGDGVIESCRAVGLTMCDTTGDGFSDTPCIIELAAEPAPTTQGPGSSE